MFKPPLRSTLLPRLLTGSSFLSLNLIYWPYAPSLGGSFVSREMDTWCQSREHRKHHSFWQLNKFFDFTHWRLRGKWIRVAWHWKDFFLPSLCVCAEWWQLLFRSHHCVPFMFLESWSWKQHQKFIMFSVPTWNRILPKPSRLYPCRSILWVSRWEDGHPDMMDGSWLATCSEHVIVLIGICSLISGIK